MSVTAATVADIAADFLVSVGKRVRDKVLSGRDVDRDSVAVGVSGGDMIYAIDRRVEQTLVDVVATAPDELGTLTLVAEGLDNTHGAMRSADKSGPARFRLLVDPIDGTRGLMYDKRSAWFLAALAPDRGEATSLSDVIASAMVEIPTSKQSWTDSYWAGQEGAVSGIRENLDTGAVVPLRPEPSQATTLRGGFAQVSNFFPGTKRLASDLMERIAAASLGAEQAGMASIFEDQYICSGGQMVELMTGRDRFGCDLRPLFYRALELEGGAAVVRGLECHPYDLAGAHVARLAGVILTDGFGRRLDGPFDVTTGMHWIGYANEALRRQIEPVVQDWLRERGLVAS